MNMQYQNENTYISSDFYVATFLKAAGLTLIGINKTDPRRFRFIFEDTKDRADLLDNYFAGHATVEPRGFVMAIKELKSLMYSDALERD